MGTYYSVGIVKEFNACPAKALDAQALEKYVGERFNLDLFDVSFREDSLSGTLKPGLFDEYIADFIEKLANIAPNSRSTITYYLESYGHDIEQYPLEMCEFVIYDSDKNRIKINATFALLFIEGKVSAEQFTTEPMLLNWLFRHSDFGNPLAGAVLSDIVG